MKHLRKTVAATLLASAGISTAGNTGSTEMTKETNAVFETVEKLFDNRPFSVEYVELLLRTTLEQNADISSDYFEVYEGAVEAETGVTGVQVRVPVNQADGRDGLITLDVDTDLCIESEDVHAWLGEGEPVDPQANQPSSVPNYVRHRFDWGTASFGFERMEQKCLTTIVMDATAG